jgi:hypothetical protein
MTILRGVALALLALGLVGVGVGVGWMTREPPQDDLRPGTDQVGVETSRSQPEAAASVRVDRGAAAAAAANGASTTAVIPPAPPTDAPLVQQLPHWRSRAATRDPYAQCRFAVLAAQCVMMDVVYAPWARARYETSEIIAADANARADCRGVDRSLTAGYADHLHDAAQRGHVPSQVQFAAGRSFGAGIPDLTDVAALRRFRDSAAALAWRAFAAGDSDAAVLLWRAYNRVDADYLLLVGSIEPDPVKAHALDLLMDDLLPEFVVGSASDAGLDPTHDAAAQALVAAWRAGPFAQARVPRFGLRIEEQFGWEHRDVDVCAP